MTTILGGVAGGVIATIVMTVFMRVLGDDSPPSTAVLWSKYVGDGPPEEYMVPGMALHLIYGVGAGVAFVVFFPFVGVDLASLEPALFAGVAWAIVLTVINAFFWKRAVLDMEPEPREAGMFTVFHLIYGVVLGAVVGAGFFG